MEKINFINNSLPAINATNLNQLQDNFENAIDSTSCDMYKPDAGTVTNTYCLVAEYNIPGIYFDFSDTIIVNRTWGNSGRLSSIIVNVAGRFNSIETIMCSVNYMTKKIDEIQIIAVTNIINDVANIKLYVKSIAQYTIISAKSLDYKKTGNITRQYYKDQPNITELPTGTQIHGKLANDTGWIDMSSYINTANFAARPGQPPMARRIGNTVYWKGMVHCISNVNNQYGHLLRNLPDWVVPNYEFNQGSMQYESCIPYTIYIESIKTISVCQATNIEVQGEASAFSLCNLNGYLID